MSNSKLVNYTRISPNSSVRTGKISKITIHHMAGNGSVEACGAIFASADRKASSNYGIGSDGRVGLYCPEDRRSWCSSSAENDQVAVTIEVANCGGSPDWPVSDQALATLIDLCVDICQRNGIAKLNYTGDKSGNLTMHKWFANTQCPGPYLESKFPYIADEVNKRLGVTETPKVEPEEIQPATLAVGDVVTITADAKYTSGKTPAAFVFNMKLYVRAISGDNITISTLKSGAITGIVHRKYIVKDGVAVTPAPEPEVESKAPYLVQVKVTDLYIRKGPSTSYGTNGVIPKGVYTIVEEKDGFGKLKSGIGWISLNYVIKL